MGEQLDSLQKRYGGAIDKAIQLTLDDQSGPCSYLDMMRYQLGYVDEQRGSTPGRGGKRFRPALCLLACEAVCGQADAALQAAAGIELLHNFSLIHDDIEDRDPSRRHRPTVWKVWGEPQAINVGDAMFTLACYTLATKGNSPLTAQVTNAFLRTTFELTEGQYLDMSYESNPRVSTDQYLAMISLKTASLIGFALWCGGRIGGAEIGACEALREFGLCLGRAFQIFDDIQGIWASSSQTGKEAYKDLVNRKKTLPVLIAWERATPEQAEVLDGFFRHSSIDVLSVRQIIDQTNAADRCREVGKSYLEQGLDVLQTTGISEPFRQKLAKIAVELTGQ